MSKKKLLTALISCFLVVCILAVPAAARYVAINSFTAEYGKDGTTAYCGSTVDVRTGYDYELVLVLQRSSNGGISYSNYYTFPTIYGVGNDRSKAYEKSRSGVSNSYIYRTKAILTVLDSNGNEVESDDCYSNY
ncbi:hypothetical protein [Anaerotruncus rubiinfantis]|uniref:hypothetical protein n=1 Tax=Anaerotruncus rubiinfantis TaxID=1720200 RepID=UPI0034A54A0F